MAFIEQQLTNDVRLLQIAVEQLVGPERRQRLTRQAWYGEG